MATTTSTIPLASNVATLSLDDNSSKEESSPTEPFNDTLPPTEEADVSDSPNGEQYYGTEQPKPVPKIIYRLDYINAISGEKVFSDDMPDQPKKKFLDLPAFEIITTAYTTHDRKTLLPTEGAKHKPPPMSSRGVTAIAIRSPAVIDALRTIIGYYPGEDLSGDLIHISYPFEMIVHYENELREYRDAFSPEISIPDDCTGDSDVYEDLGILLDLVMERVGREVHEERQKHLQDEPVATFKMVWMLFKPGTDVYYDYLKDGEYNAYVVRALDITMYDGHPYSYEIHLWNMDCDTKYVGASGTYSQVISPFTGEKAISSMAVFPCQYLQKEKHGKTHEEMKSYLENRGKMFYRLQTKQCMKFDGLGTGWPKRKYAGLVMVDMAQYILPDENGDSFENPKLALDIENTISSSPSCHCVRCTKLTQRWSLEKKKFAGYSKINPLLVDGLTPHQYFLCDNSMKAYIFKLREWKSLHLDGFSDPKWEVDLINTLVLPDLWRNLLQKLAHKYARQDNSSNWSADFIESKGEGIIFLLHGKPGVGKTYTAECIAQETKRPLLSLTCSDIGTDPETVESRLEFWFKLAKSWGAILLLDEADVYMEQRSISDLTRNNLVAGFLRKMEYYQGILFLTTNRVGTFDEAFLSRISVAIYYPEFNDSQRVQIWNTFFSKLEQEREGEMRIPTQTKYYVAEDKALLSLKWNAREIRNAFQTAVALAEVEGKKDANDVITVDIKHIQAVVDMSQNFKNYLAELYQKNDADRAAARGIRYDYFGVKPSIQEGLGPI